MIRFALAGNPNCGKTTLFNSLTGSTAYVGNWPGVTVDKREGVYKKGSKTISIIDLPGIYSLSPYTPEEVIARQYILDEKPDCIINIVDATNLERNLYLSTQIMEIDVPVVIALNMMDVLKKNGDTVDVKQIQEKLGVPVIEISALKEYNLEKLMNVAYDESLKKRKGTTVLENSVLKDLIQKCKNSLKDKNIDNCLFHSIKLIEMDELEVKRHPDLIVNVDEFKKSCTDEVFDNDLEAVIADARYKYISDNFSTVKTENKNTKKTNLSKSDKIDRVLTNKWAGIPIFLVILFLIFHLTFSSNLFFLGGLFNENSPVCFEGSIFEDLIWTSDGINSPGVILQNLMINITDWLTSVVSGWLSSSEAWVSGLICDGILGGLFAVLSFSPQILLLFLFFSILEDSGYMARVAFILDRIFRKFGLSGRAFMPMIMGFGCSVPAMINTRTLADDKERIATIRVIPFFSCGAKLPILTAIAGGIVSYFGILNADLITYSMYLVGMIVAIVTIILMRNTTLKGSVPPFIMELPAYHAPQFKSLMIHLWDKLKHFIKKTFTIILASTIVIWFLSNFGWDWRMTDMDESILASLGKLIQPLFTPLGFGSQLLAFGWVFAVAAVTGLIAKENVIATFFTLACAIVSVKFNIGSDFSEALQSIDETSVGVIADIVKALIADVNDKANLINSLVTALQELETDPTVINNIVNAINLNDGISAVRIYLESLSVDENVMSSILDGINTIITNKEEMINYIDILFEFQASEKGVSEAVAMIQATGITVPGLISFIAFNMTTIPCFAACATAKAELPKNKFWFTILFWVLTSYIVSTMIYLVLSYTWTIAIFVVLIALVILAIYLYNHKVLTKRKN